MLVTGGVSQLNSMVLTEMTLCVCGGFNRNRGDVMEEESDLASHLTSTATDPMTR